VLCLVTQLCLTLWDPMDCSPKGSSDHGDSPGKNTGVGGHAFLQEIFPTQGSNPGLLQCRQILYQLGHLGISRYICVYVCVCVCVCVCVWLIHAVVQQKPTLHCKAIFLQLKNKFKKCLIKYRKNELVHRQGFSNLEWTDTCWRQIMSQCNPHHIPPS